MTRFAKGQSGNPKGRPRRARDPRVSAFDVIMDKTLTVTQGGRTRELTLEEALQHKTYEEALAGNRSARREVLKMIAKREKSLAATQPHRDSPIEVLVEHGDPQNAEEALLILGVAALDASWSDHSQDKRRLLLEPWAVEAALRRRRSRPLESKEVSEIRRCTRDPDTIRWPMGRGS